VSYSGSDRKAARAIDEYLRARGISTFFDRRNLTAGAPWFDELERALQSARGAMVLIGQSGLGSIQKRELQFALMRQAEVEGAAGAPPFRVIPVLLPPYAADEVPGFAALNTWVEVADAAEPTELLEALRDSGEKINQSARKSPLCPFRALNSFREEDAALYFGRTAPAAVLRNLILQKPFVAVVGPSGSGKSSLVQAGLLPLLRAERPPAATWEAITFTPGKRPFYNAGSALAGLWLGEEAVVSKRVAEAEQIEQQLAGGTSRLASYVHEALKNLPNGTRLLIVVDQFEELFTLTADKSVQRGLVDGLFSCVDQERCHVVITLRADYYGRAIELGTRMTSVLQEAQLSVGPMEEADLRQVILGPSQRAGLELEDGLVERMLQDVALQPGSLPLLEFALTELWNRSPDGRLTHVHYNAIGGIAGAISTRADAVLTELGGAKRDKARQVLTRLVRVSSSSEEGANTRQVLFLDELDEDGRRIIEAFARARLVVSGREDDGPATAEVSHEALIRSWSTLKTWIDEEFQFLIWRQRLDFFVSEWESTKEDPSSLLNGARLVEARRWQRTHSKDLNARESRFIDAAVKGEAGSRFRRSAAAVLLVAAVLAGGAYYCWIQTDAYAVRQVLRDAPLRDAALSNRSDDDPYLETLQDWIAALVRHGQDAAAREAVRTMESRDSVCVRATEAAHRRARGEWPEGEPLPGIDQLPGWRNEALYCASRLPLTESERARVLQVARDSPSHSAGNASQDEYLNQFSTILAARAALALNAEEDARYIAEQGMGIVLRAAAPVGQEYLVKVYARHLGALLSQENRFRLMEVAARAGKYSATECRAILLAQDVGLDGLEGFVDTLARETAAGGPPLPRPADVLFDRAVADVTGQILARGVRAGEVKRALMALEPLAQRMEQEQFGRPSVVALILPLLEELVAARHTADALALAARVRPHVAAIQDEDQRSRALSRLARAYAGCGRVKEAKSLADSARRSLDRLAAYTAIVEKYHAK
jgi:energy-coupling factor transporter ATP-binding protein EcfA2